MPLPGGPTDKFGNRYEGRWTVFCMSEVMREHADSIRLELPGEDGAEFRLCKAEQCVYHQVKRQQSSTGRWLLSDLGRKGVLSYFWQKLREELCQCTFVSAHPAYQLEELAYRARGSLSWVEFDKAFLKGEYRDTFASLQSSWDAQPEEAYEALKSVYVRTIDEETLLTMVESALEYLVEGDPTTIRSLLADFVLSKIHAVLTAHDIWRYLEEKGHHRRHWDNDPHVLVATQEATTRYLDSFRDATINGQVIPRDAARTVLDLFTRDDNQRCALISGEAGSGKSSTILQVIQGCRERNWPLLAFRADRLHSTQLPKDVGQQIGLPGSPANVLAAIAQEKECLLVIDQLDAISLTSGRHPEMFDCLFEIIRQAMSHPNMRILLACRKFDLEYDQRLRWLTDQDRIAYKVALGRLAPVQVQQIVSALGLDAQQLTPKQFDLLSIPLHLRLLGEIIQDSSIRVLSFETAKDLFDRFWEVKSRKIRERSNRDIQWTEVIDTLAEHMSTHQVLFAPISAADRYQADAEAMESEHTLVRDGGLYSFFHESFFDYAFARRFVVQGRRLVDLLVSSEQHLFRRAQVRQILLHEREASRQHYLADLKAVLTDPRTRFHVKQVIFALLAELRDPTEQEWRITAPLIKQTDDPQTRLIWHMLASSLPWCFLLDSLHVLEHWLSGNDQEYASKVVSFLLPLMHKQTPDRVAALIEPHIEQEMWGNRLIFLVQATNVGANRRFFDLFLRLLDKGTLDGLLGHEAHQTNHFWTIISSLPQTSPTWACEAIKHYFGRLLVLGAGAESTQESALLSRVLSDPSSFSDGVLMRSAQGAPEVFVTQLLPLVIQLIESNAEEQERALKRDSVWGTRHSHGEYTVYSELLRSMEQALGHLALHNPDAFAQVFEQIRKLPLETAQYLLMRAFISSGERWANEAVNYLCERPELLQIGYIDAPYWAARQLVETISPHCSEEQLRRLEQTILDYYPEQEKQAQWRHLRGYLQFTVLDGIIPSRRTPVVVRRLEEWKRKFGIESAEGPSPHAGVIGASLVESPLPPDTIEKMTDEQWLNAIARYNQEELSIRFDGLFVGGLQQIARQMEAQVKREPMRFARLVHRFPDDTHPYYFQAILRGMTDTDVGIDIAVDVCRRCHRLSIRPCGRVICDLLASFATSPLPTDALDIVAWYATEDSDPAQEIWHESDWQGHDEHSDAIFMAGINSVRGRAAEVIGELIFHRPERAHHFLPSLERMIQDPSVSVRACVAKTLQLLFLSQPEPAVSLFTRLCEGNKALLKTGYVEHFLTWSAEAHLEAVLPIIDRMLTVEEPAIATVGARAACIASLVSEAARPLAVRCLAGTEAHRQGAANVFARHLRFVRFRSQCEEALLQLFRDPDERVQEEAVRCFLHFEKEELGEYLAFAEAFVQTPGFKANPYTLLTTLKRTTARCPALICLVCEQLIAVFQSEEVSKRLQIGPPTDTISQLVLRGYSQSMEDMNESLQRRCLDIIDALPLIGTSPTNEMLDEYDR
jgi:hypothetical protein